MASWFTGSSSTRRSNGDADHQDKAAEGNRVHVEGVQIRRVADVRQQQKRDGGNQRLDPFGVVSKRRQQGREASQAEHDVEHREPPDIEARPFIVGSDKLNGQPSEKGLAGLIRAVPEILCRPYPVRLKEREVSGRVARGQAQPAGHSAEIASVGNADEAGKKQLPRQQACESRQQCGR